MNTKTIYSIAIAIFICVFSYLIMFKAKSHLVNATVVTCMVSAILLLRVVVLLAILLNSSGSGMDNLKKTGHYQFLLENAGVADRIYGIVILLSLTGLVVGSKIITFISIALFFSNTFYTTVITKRMYDVFNVHFTKLEEDK